MVMKLVPKEKELGVLARIFGIQTHQARYKNTVQESNAMHFLDNYCRDQTMTLDSLQLAKRLQKFRTLKKVYKGWRVLYVNYDVSGWCSNFRDETVTPVVRETLDKYYGVNLYSKTELAYEKTMYTLPGTKETYGFRGLAGGIEGLNQYTWMSIYTTQMRKVLEEEGLQFHVLSYGDDYKAALLIPPHQVERDIQTWKDLIVKNVTTRVKIDFGHNMKEYDSYGSECFLTFCKQTSVHGVELPSGLRKVQKMYGSENTYMPLIDDYIASTFSNGHSSAKQSPGYYAPYIISLFWCLHHLLNHHLYSKLSLEELTVITLTPSSMGGLPIIFLHNFAIRAESDLLTSFVDLTYFTQTFDPEIGALMTNQYTFAVAARDDIIGLLKDPYSLPISKHCSELISLGNFCPGRD